MQEITSGSYGTKLNQNGCKKQKKIRSKQRYGNGMVSNEKHTKSDHLYGMRPVPVVESPRVIPPKVIPQTCSKSKRDITPIELRSFGKHVDLSR